MVPPHPEWGVPARDSTPAFLWDEYIKAMEVGTPTRQGTVSSTAVPNIQCRCYLSLSEKAYSLLEIISNKTGWPSATILSAFLIAEMISSGLSMRSA